MVGEEVDAASLLWRLDMEGQDVSDKWEKVAEGIGSQGSFGSIPFVNAQLCYALKRGGKHKALQESLAAIEQFTMLQQGENQRVWTEVGNSLIQGSLAFADQDYKAVLHYFEPIISQIGCCGGSDAQVDLFRQAYLKSLIGVGIRGKAQSFLEQMTKGRGMTPLESKWLKESKRL